MISQGQKVHGISTSSNGKKKKKILTCVQSGNISNYNHGSKAPFLLFSAVLVYSTTAALPMEAKELLNWEASIQRQAFHSSPLDNASNTGPYQWYGVSFNEEEIKASKPIKLRWEQHIWKKEGKKKRFKGRKEEEKEGRREIDAGRQILPAIKKVSKHNRMGDEAQ